MMAVHEAHTLYQEEYPEDTVGLTKFTSLRPCGPLQGQDAPQHVYLHLPCQHRALAARSEAGALHPTTHSELLQQVICDPGSEDCMFGQSEECVAKVTWESLLESTQELLLGDQVKWLEWIQNDAGQVEKMEETNTMADAIRNCLLPSPLLHQDEAVRCVPSDAHHTGCIE